MLSHDGVVSMLGARVLLDGLVIVTDMQKSMTRTENMYVLGRAAI